jgi:tetratricopeptide (TPR) repeat protein
MLRGAANLQKRHPMTTRLSAIPPRRRLLPWPASAQSRAASLFAFSLLATGTCAKTAIAQALQTDLQKAAAFHERSDYIHSIPILKRIIRQSPGNYTANLLLGEDLLHTGATHEAVSALQAACGAKPEDATAEVFLAEAFATLGDFSGASEALETALTRSRGAEPYLEAWAGFCLDRVQALGNLLRNTAHGEAVLLRIEAALRPEGSLPREKLLERSAAEDPGQRGIWGELGAAQLEIGDQAHAIESLSNARSREPDGEETLQLEALLAALHQDWPAAEARLTELAAHSPAAFQSAVGLWLHVLLPRHPVGGISWECLRNTAMPCPADLMQPQGAIASGPKTLYAEGRWEQLIALPRPVPTDSAGALMRGFALAETGDCTQAIPELERGLKTDLLTAAFWLHVCYANEGVSVVARLQSNGNSAIVHQLQGDIQLHLHGDAAAAQAQYADALKIDPRNPQLLERSAEAYLTLGNIPQAKHTAEAALAIDVHNASAIKTLAMVAIDRRDYPEALVQLKRLGEINPTDSWTRVELGITCQQLGDSSQALAYLGPELASGYPDPKGAFHAQLANILRKLGRLDEARQASAEAERLANATLEDAAPRSSNATE